MSLRTYEKVSVSLTIRKMHFTIISKYHFAPSTLAEIKLLEKTVLMRVWGNRHSSTLLVKVKIRTTFVKGNLYMHIFFDPAIPLLEIYRTKDAPICKMTYVQGHSLQQSLNSKRLKTSTEYWLNAL